MEWLKNLFGTSKEALNEQVKDINEKVTLVLKENADLKEQKEKLAKDLDDLLKKDETKRNSDTPWIEILSDGYDEKKGISISLDWNQAFIDYLTVNGITGSTDEEVVRKYLAFLYDDLIAKFQQEEINAKERKGKISDFE